MWFDASDSNSFTLNGSSVSEWRDKSGNGRHATQATSGNQPTYTTNTLNGKPVVTFGTGGAKSLVLPNISIASAPTSVFLVLNDTKNTGHEVAFVVNGGSGTLLSILLTNHPNTNKWGTYTNTDVEANGSIGSSYVIASVQNDGTNFFFYKDGTSDGSPTYSSNNAFSSSYLGSDQYGSYFGGNIAEVVFCTSNLSTQDRQNVEGYLARKWGLTNNLPVNHPYKSVAPTL